MNADNFIDEVLHHDSFVVFYVARPLCVYVCLCAERIYNEILQILIDIVDGWAWRKHFFCFSTDFYNENCKYFFFKKINANEIFYVI